MGIQISEINKQIILLGNMAATNNTPNNNNFKICKISQKRHFFFQKIIKIERKIFD